MNFTAGLHTVAAGDAEVNFEGARRGKGRDLNTVNQHKNTHTPVLLQKKHKQDETATYLERGEGSH